MRPRKLVGSDWSPPLSRHSLY